MKSNVGIDIEEVARFSRLIRDRRFLNRVYTTQEINYCRSKRNSAQHFAVRFAAKEAVWKALSDLIRSKKLKLSHQDIGVRNEVTGKPAVVFPKKLTPLARKISLSLSHTKSTVVAVALFG